MNATLKPRINLFAGISMAVCMIVGSGLFGIPGVILQQMSAGYSIIAWILAAFLSLPLVHIFAFLGSRYPYAEGVAKYAEISLGKWAMYSVSLIACGSLAVGMPAFFLVIGSYFAELFNLPPATYKATFAIIGLLFATSLNLLGPEKAALLNKMVVPAIILFALGITISYLPDYGTASGRMVTETINEPFSWSRVWVGCTIAFWAFQGWENLSFGLEEIENPKWAIPKIYYISYVIVLLIYIPFVWTIAVVSFGGHYDLTGLSGLSQLLGQGTIRLLLLLMVVGVLLSNSVSWVFGASRIMYTSAQKGLLPGFMMGLNKNNLPKNSLLILGAYNCSIILLVDQLGIDISTLFLLTTQGFIILYGISVFTFIKLVTNPFQKSIGITGLLACTLLLTGFSWMLIYSVALGLLGWIIYRKQLKNEIQDNLIRKSTRLS